MSTAAIVISVCLMCLTLVALGILWMLVRRHEQSVALEKEALARQRDAEARELNHIAEKMTELDRVVANAARTASTQAAALEALTARISKLEQMRLGGLR